MHSKETRDKEKTNNIRVDNSTGATSWTNFSRVCVVVSVGRW